MSTGNYEKLDLQTGPAGALVMPPGAEFDQWLTHHLKQLYDPVVNEPLPPELLRLLHLRLE